AGGFDACADRGVEVVDIESDAGGMLTPVGGAGFGESEELADLPHVEAEVTGRTADAHLGRNITSRRAFEHAAWHAGQRVLLPAGSGGRTKRSRARGVESSRLGPTRWSGRAGLVLCGCRL